MADNSLYMIAGLGNPGDQYARTRHNLGFMVVDELVYKFSFQAFKSKNNALFSKGQIFGKQVLLVKPQSFMNRSGMPVQQISSFFKISYSDIIIVHDDLDLSFGTLKICKNRGHGGHNGIRSIMDILGTKDLIRVRVGVGRPNGAQRDVTSHVLGCFSSDERASVESIVAKSADACAAVLKSGLQTAMNIINA